MSKVKVKKKDGFKVTLPSGNKVKIRVRYGTDFITKKAKDPWGQIVRKDGEPVKVKVEVPSTFLRIIFSDKKKFTSRSCCKPPDVFSRLTGKKFALKHLLEQDPNKKLFSNEDRKFLYQVLCPKFFGQKVEVLHQVNSRIVAKEVKKVKKNGK